RPFDQLHRDPRPAGVVAHLEDADDVRVVETLQRAELAPEPPRAADLAQQLDRDQRARARVLRPPDLAHGALAQALQELVRTERSGGHDRASLPRATHFLAQ